ncbi:molybdopterin molybdotransferase MoeA [Nocardiopsis potens]|uniref:molybdopterin molybdotransferase MoeA n=1 Tax=Nocardiopsis potens TaxID=1246458 RepID=UPI00036B2BFF|nr:molybdopterin molybdotransferase MoeA [Nocardiopsis potens]
MGRGERTPAPWERARSAARALGERCGPAAVRTVPLSEALGAVLAADLTALVGIPDCDTSAMDGYAVAGPGPWAVTGRVLAGAAPSAVPLAAGTAVEIATGAPVPPGADAVLPLEQAVRTAEDAVAADGGPPAPGRHIRRAGEDTRPGDIVVKQGSPVAPAVLGLAAALGHDTLPVYRPRVAVLVTGDEVVPAGIPAPGAVRDAIGPMLPGVAAWAGAQADPPVRVRDRLGGTVGALRAAAGSGADAIAVCGASSKGPADHLRPALAALGAEVVVDGVACRPGHPQLLAHLGPPSAPGPAVVGLPGNPNAALVAALTLLVPVLAAIGGRPDPAAAEPARARVLDGIDPHPRDTRLVAVRADADGVRPIGHDRPGSLRSPAAADAYAVIPPGWRGPEAELLRLPR